MATETFTTPGAGTWVCPAGVTSVQVECWGGGAAGNQGFAGITGNEGGGGGAYAKTTAKIVVPGASYSYNVGAGGVTDGGNGGATDFDSNATKAVGASGRNGGAAASCVGDVKSSGGTASNVPTATDGTGGGGAGGPGGNGSNGGIPAGGNGDGGVGNGGRGGDSTNDAAVGTQPGGGGGGGGGVLGHTAGKNGADGQIVLTYTVNLTPLGAANAMIHAV